MRLTFRAKLFAIVAIAALAFVLLIVVSGVLARRGDAQLAVIQRTYIPKVVLQPELDGASERLRRGFQDAVAAHDLESLGATEKLKARFLEDLDAASGAVDAGDLRALRVAVEDYYGAAYGVSRRLIANETGEALVEAMGEMQRRQTRMAVALEKATAFDRGELRDAFATATQSAADAQKLQLTITVAGLALVLVISFALSRTLVRSVNELTAGFARLGAGSFDRPIVVQSTDELGDLARQANEMAAKLERSQMESKRAEAKFRDLVESAPDAIVIAGSDGRIAIVNAEAERLFGRRRDALVGGPVDVLLPERLRGTDPGHRRGYLKDPGDAPAGSNFELVGRHEDGSEFPIEVSQRTLRIEDQPLVSSAIRDITERKRIEVALETSNRELEAFSYSVAHDLRAPLRGINGFSRALLEDFGDKLDAQGKNYLERIGAGSERMGLLIDALLSLSRVSRVDLSRETVNLSRTADGVMKQLRMTQPEREVSFVNQDDVSGHGDPALLRALLDNLLGNAWKFTGKRPDARIEFGTTRKGDTLVYFVKDNGAGFDMAYADKLFAPFQRLHQASEFAGTGIGLATVQRIVHRHGGEIWAEGAVGAGATFSFTLAAPVASKDRS
jgi:PAS domain S-box-containing protein